LCFTDDITGRNRSNFGLIEGCNSAERLESWKKHFSELLGPPPRVPKSDISSQYTLHRIEKQVLLL
jgi:hypothetical protein